jgi:ATP phosphoribosyltransferase regulatory subunit
VTLSIVKNVRDDGGLQKLYYNENVYRARPGDRSYREIMQTGLECIGELDAYNEGEVVMLACRSLREVSPDYILDLSHQGYLSGLLSGAGLMPDNCGALLACFKDKNVAAVTEYCAQRGVAKEYTDRLASLAGAYGPFDEMIGRLAALCDNEEMEAAVEELRGLFEHLRVCGCAENVNIDLSIVNDMRYYNGVIFQASWRAYLPRCCPAGATTGCSGNSGGAPPPSASRSIWICWSASAGRTALMTRTYCSCTTRPRTRSLWLPRCAV